MHHSRFRHRLRHSGGISAEHFPSLLPGRQIPQPRVRRCGTGTFSGVGDRRSPRRLRLGRGEFGEGHYHCGGGANATINEALKSFYSLFRCFACRPAAFLSVWGGQPEREASLFNLKFLAARVRVYVRQLADGRVFAAVCGQPVFALLDGSYAQAAASALVALLLCPFAAPMLLSLAGSALIVAASALFAWLF